MWGALLQCFPWKWGEQNSPPSSGCCCPQIIHPGQGPVSYTDQYLSFIITCFRSFLPVLNFITTTRGCSRTGVPSSCGASFFALSSCPHEDKLQVSWITYGVVGVIDTHYSPVLHFKSIVSPPFTCAPSLWSLAVSPDSLKFLLRTPNPNTRAFLVQGAPVTFLSRGSQ